MPGSRTNCLVLFWERSARPKQPRTLSARLRRCRFGDGNQNRTAIAARDNLAYDLEKWLKSRTAPGDVDLVRKQRRRGQDLQSDVRQRRRNQVEEGAEAITDGRAAARLKVVSGSHLSSLAPGDFIPLDNVESAKGPLQPVFMAVLACPVCGAPCLITSAQYLGAAPVVCGSKRCSGQFRIVDGDDIVHLPAN
jgi:uncharacterized protein YbaR (Trm112 family)